MIVELRRILFLAGGGLLTLVSACESQKPQYQGPYAEEVGQAVPMIEKAVGLKFKSPPKIETRSKEQVREFVVKQFIHRTYVIHGVAVLRIDEQCTEIELARIDPSEFPEVQLKC